MWIAVLHRPPYRRVAMLPTPPRAAFFPRARKRAAFAAICLPIMAVLAGCTPRQDASEWEHINYINPSASQPKKAEEYIDN